MVTPKLSKTQAFAYDRISSDVQSDGMSLSYQGDSAHRYAEYMNLEVVRTFSVVESARKEGRKIFNEMIDTALASGVKHIIFKNTDRMSRNYSDLVRLENLIDKEDFVIHFYQNNRILNKDSNHNDRFILGIELAVAKHLSDKISHDIKEAHRFKVKQGIFPNKPPIGYIYDTKNKRHIIDPKNGPIMHQVFNEFDNGEFSLDQFCRHLNDRGIRTAKGHPWIKQNLHRVLTSPFYHGEFEYKGAIWNGVHETYYDKTRYTQRMKKLSSSGNGRETKHAYPLNGFMRCSCGYALYGARVKDKYTYYIHNCQTAGKQVSIMEDDAVKRIGTSISDYLMDDSSIETIRTLFKETIQEKSENLKDEISNLNRQISEIRAKKKRLFDLYADDDIDRKMLNESISELNTVMDDLEKKLKTAELYGDKVFFAISEILDNIRSFTREFNTADDYDRIPLIKQVVQGIKIDGDLTTVYFKKPYSFILRPELPGIRKFTFARLIGVNETEHKLIETIIADVANWMVA